MYIICHFRMHKLPNMLYKAKRLVAPEDRRYLTPKHAAADIKNIKLCSNLVIRRSMYVMNPSNTESFW